MYRNKVKPSFISPTVGGQKGGDHHHHAAARQHAWRPPALSLAVLREEGRQTAFPRGKIKQ